MEDRYLNEGVKDLSLYNYKNHGFQIVKIMRLRHKVEKVKNILEMALENAQKKFTKLGFYENGVLDKIAISKVLSDKKNKLDPETRQLLTGQFPIETRLNEHILNLAKDKELIRQLNAKTNAKIDKIHMPPMARFVLPEYLEAAVPAHQDSSYNKHMNDFITSWIPIVDIDEKCGGVTVFPGVMKEIENLNLGDNGQWLDSLKINNKNSINCTPMSLGDILILNKNTIHKSMKNKSRMVRFSLDLRYMSQGSKTEKHYFCLNSKKIIKPN